MLKAAYYFGLCEQEDKKRKCLGQALGMVFEKGVPKDQQRYAKALDRIADRGLQRIAALWEQIGKAEDKKNPTEQNQEATQMQSVPELFEELMTYSKTYADAVVQCLSDTLHQLITHCSAQQILKLLQGLEETDARALADELENKMLEISKNSWCAKSSPSNNEFL